MPSVLPTPDETRPRIGSPVGGSTLITSAPQSASLDPRDRDVGETVVELGDVDVGGREIGALPQRATARDGPSEEEVVGVHPIRPLAGSVGERVDDDRPAPEVTGAFGRGEDR